MVNRFFLFLLLSVFTGVFKAQTSSVISKLTLPAIDDGWMEVDEAETISEYIIENGWPVSRYEVWSIEGLRIETYDRLSKNPTWHLWCKWGYDSALNSKGNTINGYLQSMVDYDNEVELSLNLKHENLGFLLSRDVGSKLTDVSAHYHGKFLTNSSRTLKIVVGDHRLHWGTGVTIDRFDPYSSMRSPHRLSLTSRPFDAVYSTNPSLRRRGGAISLSRGGNWAAISLDASDPSLHIVSSFFRTIQVGTNRLNTGVIATSKGRLGAVMGGEFDHICFQAEYAWQDGSWSFLNSIVMTAGRNTIVFGSLSNFEESKLGVQFGDYENSLRVIAKTNNDDTSLSILSNKEITLNGIGIIQSRINFNFNTLGDIDLGLRLRYDLESVRITAEVKKSIFSPLDVFRDGYQKALRLDIRGDRHFTFAFMNGIDNMDCRLYQLLPTARGYRLLSINEGQRRAIFTMEIIRNKLMFSVERVWSKETSEIYPNDFSKRISLRIAGG